MKIWVLIGSISLLAGCAGMGSGGPNQNPPAGMGQYQQPFYQRPEPVERFPRDDECRSRLFLGLVGQHEGGIVFSALPGRTRVVKPAETEQNLDDFLADMRPDPPFVQITEYLAGQVLYAPAIKAVRLGDALGPIERDRLTVELDAFGYVRELTCR
ncbi:MAG: hypothetical protein JKX72_05170 [Robiginitomaculum sp.]|nr:hypothetical protein [Robiginitomaculum sp.]